MKTINVRIISSNHEKHGQMNISKEDLSWIVNGRNSKYLKVHTKYAKDDEEGGKVILNPTTSRLDKKTPLVVKFYDRGKNSKEVGICLLGLFARHPELRERLSKMNPKDKVFLLSKQRIEDSKNNRASIQFVVWLNKNPKY